MEDKILRQIKDTLNRPIEEWDIDILRARYKDLEEQNHIYRGQLNDAFDRGFIHISVIQNKIRELKQIKDTALTDRTIEMMNDKIQILELLLEERE